MERPRRNEHFFTLLWSEPPAVHLQFQVAFHDHQEFIGRMDIVFPYLPRRVNPEPATEPAGVPIPFNFPLVNFRNISHAEHLQVGLTSSDEYDS
jgi:hypothetical protein